MPRRALEIAVFGILLVVCAGTLAFVYDQSGRAEDVEVGSPGRADPAKGRAPPPVDVEPLHGRAPGGGGLEADPDPDAERGPKDGAGPPLIDDGTAATDRDPDVPDPDPEPPEDKGEPALVQLEFLEPAKDKDRAVKLRVVDTLGEPILGALAVFRTHDEILYRMRTQADGRAWFEPYATERGPFRVDVLGQGFSTATVKELEEGTEVTVELKTRPTVFGRVRAPSVKGGYVKVYMNTRVRQADIQEDGSFQIEDLDVGLATVQAVVEPFGSDAVDVELVDGEVQHVQLRIRTGKKIRLAGEIGAWPDEGKFWINNMPVAVSRSGTWKFERAVWGVNEFLVDAPGRALYRKRVMLKKGLKPDLDFRLLKEAKIKGKVKELNGRKLQWPVAGATVRCGVDFGEPRNWQVPNFPIELVPVVKTDREGRYEIGRLDPRLVYEVMAVADGRGSLIQTVMPGTPGSVTNIGVPRGPYLYGKIKGFGGIPRDAQVVATPLGDPDPQLRFNVDEWNVSRGGRNRKGYFGLAGLLPGSYIVTIDASDFATIEAIVEIDFGEVKRLNFRMWRRDLAEDDLDLLERLPPVFHDDAEMMPPPEEITRLVLDVNREAHQAPFRAVRVEFFSGKNEIYPPLEFDTSRIDLPGLPRGTWRAILTHSTLRKPVISDNIVLKIGEQVEVALR